MDTLVSLGVTAAYAWSVAALTIGDAGHLGMTHGFSWTAERGDGLSLIYLEVAAGVTTFLLAGRYAEKRAKRRAGAALRALLALSAAEAWAGRAKLATRPPEAARTAEARAPFSPAARTMVEISATGL